MIRFLAVVLLALAAPATAQVGPTQQFPMVPYSRLPGAMVNGNLSGPMVTNTPGVVGPPPVSCGAGQLDFSDACNTTLYMVLLR